MIPLITKEELDDLKRDVIPLQKRLHQLIVDEIPTGSHRARAEAWTRLAERCNRAAGRHLAVAERRDEVRAYVTRFEPAYRETALKAKYGDDPDARVALLEIEARERAKVKP